MLKNMEGKVISNIDIKYSEENLPEEIIITFTDKSSVTFTADGYCDYHGSFITVSELEIK